MEKPKIVKAKRKKSRKPTAWQQILKKDLQLSEIRLFQETSDANMAIAAFDLEKRRNPKDYIK